MTKAMPWSVELLITEVAAMKNDTVKKLKSMRLPAFAEAYEKQIDQEAEYGSMSFHERLANALEVNACQSGYKTRYIRLPELFSELEAARI